MSDELYGASHEHTITPFEDCWEDLYEISNKRKEEIAAMKDERNVTKTYVKEQIEKALSDFTLKEGGITPEEVDEKIRAAIEALTADDIAGAVNKDELKDAIDAAIKDLTDNDYVIRTDLEAYATNASVDELKDEIVRRIQDGDAAVLALVAETYLTANDVLDFVTKDELVKYISERLDGYADMLDISTKLKDLTDRVDAIDHNLANLTETTLGFANKLKVFNTSLNEIDNTTQLIVKDNIRLNTSIYNNAVEIKAIKEQLDNSDTTVTSLTGRIESLETSNTEILGKVSDNETAIGDINTELTDVKKGVSDNAKSIESINKKINNLSDKTEELSELRSNIDEVSQRCRQNSTEISGLKIDSEKHATKKELAATKSELVDLILQMETGGGEGMSSELLDAKLKDYIKVADKDDLIQETIALIKGEGEEAGTLKEEYNTLVKIANAIEDIKQNGAGDIDFTELENTIEELKTSVKNIEDAEYLDSSAVEAKIDEKISEIEFPTHEDFATKEELNSVEAKVDAIEIPDVTGFATKEEIPSLDNYVTDASLEEKLYNNVTYKDFSYNGTALRKTIQLNNHDTISGIDTHGEGHNLVMLSKWDVADFGASGIIMNLNTTLDNIVTINDGVGEGRTGAIVATTTDLERYATKEELKNVSVDLTGYAKTEEVDAEIKRVEDKVDAIEIPSIEGLVKEEVLGDYLKSEDAEKTYATITELDNYIKSEDADKFAKAEVLNDYIKAAEAEDKFISTETIAGYLTLTDAANTYVTFVNLDEEIKKVNDSINTKVSYLNFPGTNLAGEPIVRKTIQLENYDTISGKDSKGEGHNLVMLSKWDVADFGAAGIVMNLNTTPDNIITINDGVGEGRRGAVIATTADIENIRTEIEEKNFVTSESLGETLADVIKEEMTAEESPVIEQIETVVTETITETITETVETINQEITKVTNEINLTIEGIETDISSKAEAEDVSILEEKLDEANKTIEDLQNQISVLADNSGSIIECVDTPESIAEIEDPHKVDMIMSDKTTINMLSTENTTITYKSINIINGSTDKSIALSARDKVNINGMTVDKFENDATASTIGRNRILISAPNLIVNNLKIAEDCNSYNIVECDSRTLVKTVRVSNVDINNHIIKHNIINVYNPDNDATITISKCKFDVNPGNTNPVRLSNYSNADKVTVTFKDVEWTYENCGAENFTYAGLVLYQPAYHDVALDGDYSHMKTWKFIFKNCKYNGELITENNFGQNNVTMYVYNDIDKKCLNPVDLGFVLEFKE